MRQNIKLDPPFRKVGREKASQRDNQGNRADRESDFAEPIVGDHGKALRVVRGFVIAFATTGYRTSNI